MRLVTTIVKPSLNLLVIAGLASMALQGCSGTGTVSDSSAIAGSAPPDSSAPRQVHATTSTAPVAEPIPESCRDIEIAQRLDTALTFYAQCGGDPRLPYPIYRPGRTTPTLDQSLAALLAGTTDDEKALGLDTGFGPVDEADQVEVDASLDAAGIAHIEMQIDGAPWLPATGEWTSDQLNSLLDPLLATVFATEDVVGLDMTGLCFAQIACDRIVTRAEWAGNLFTNAGVLLHGGCTLEAARVYPDLCTLEGVLAQPTVSGTVANVADDDTLNVRAGPGTEFFVHGELAPGATVSVTKEAAVAGDGGTWWLIDVGGTEAGWVNAAYLDIARTPAETLVDAFVRFARHPDNVTFADLPLAETIDLGLGTTMIKTVQAAELRQPETWQLDVADFRAYVGPFSALNTLSRQDIYEITLGEHPHCAALPVPPPDGYDMLERISVQPRLGLQGSCLMWNTVDFFLLPNGDVAGITLDMWEP